MGILHMFLNLYVDGGVEICTYSARGVDGAEHSRPLLVARTCIQPDADIVTHLSERILTMPDEWQTHVDTLRTKVAGMRRIRRAITFVRVVLPVPLIIVGSYKVWSDGAQHGVFGLLGDLAPYYGLSLGLIVFKYVFTQGVRWRIRSKR